MKRKLKAKMNRRKGQDDKEIVPRRQLWSFIRRPFGLRSAFSEIWTGGTVAERRRSLGPNGN